ncbi:hypothetical protein V1L54_02450 [Streptomyces sp. TRM 70361]|uniref:HEAT repeat domain-containing protein n=1 Tax=Streptomyces sp. TRM 70361 TaxID=3116553 RepID=UPI002E7AF427|nr:hypothetical protein [Streptomyces sp. TRM 70361]MEE1938282.1 hypothetical protein [Streptomyces sp. TRM 70361]
MDVAQVLDAADTHPWGSAEHAYGSAADVPGLLRALAGADAEAAAEALSGLYGCLLHQGTVYAATAEAVPYLARLAAAGCRTAELLGLLGGIAESEDEHGVARGACRAAVAAQSPLLLPLLSDADPGVRSAAAWAAGHTAAPREVLPALRERWAAEPAAAVRAELLDALVRLDPVGGAGAALAALGPAQPPRVRVVAVLACLDAGLPWTAAHHETLLSLLPAGELVAGRFDAERAEPLRYAVGALLERGTADGREAAFALLEAGLRTPQPGVRTEALWAARHACLLSRSAPARLVPALPPLLDEPSSARDALSVLELLPHHAAPAVPALAALAAGEAEREGAGDDELADRALAVLAVADPERAAPLLARDLAGRPRALDAAAGFRAPDGAPPFPFTPELLDAVRARLAAPGSDLHRNEPLQLARLLTGWGERAAAALPELRAALSRFPRAVPGALAAVCPERKREKVAGELRDAVAMGPAEGRLVAARALYGMTGETGPLLDALAAELADGVTAGVEVRCAEAARTAGELGPDAAELVPALRAALGGPAAPGKARTAPRLEADAEVAVALWRITGEAGEAVRVLDGVLARAAEEPWFRWTGVRAARAAALLGPAGRPLRPRLERLLADPDRGQAPAAALALLACAPDGVDRTAVADAVLAAAEEGADPETALEALAALADGDTGVPAGERLRRLASLAERDRRVRRWGAEHGIVRADERFRERARAVAAAVAGLSSCPLPAGGCPEGDGFPAGGAGTGRGDP